MIIVNRGGKSQKGGKHGFIGRTLAHDILARQAKQTETMRGERPYRQVEHSVVERTSLEEFTLAAEMGLNAYLTTHCCTREVLASDFNSQLERMVNYSETNDIKVFPVVPIPRRCLFFEDEQREAIGRIIKQTEQMQHMKEKRKNRRRNKKLVDMYMHGTGPKPVNGMHEQPRHIMKAHISQNAKQTEDASDDGTFSDLSDVDGLSDIDGYDSDGLDDGSMGMGVQRFNPNSKRNHVRFETNTSVTDDSRSKREDSLTDERYAKDGSGRKLSVDDTTEYSDDFDDDDSGFETEEEIVVDHAVANETHQGPEPNVDTTPSTPSRALNVDHMEGDIKYVKEYKMAIEQEVAGIDICKINANELNRIETKGFYTWRRLLSRIEDEEERVVTPYEKNIEFWRQLWRVIERSHLLLIIVDARDPLFYRVPDLEEYVKEVDGRKETMLVLNKADHLSQELRKAWAEYFKMKGIDFVFFSTILGRTSRTYSDAEMDKEDLCCRVYNVEMLLKKIDTYRQKQIVIFPELSGPNNTDIPLYTVGFVGYPNVGKSSLINCLMEATKTNVSCQPGKTKHLQTLPLKKENITLCDCPGKSVGLIFPNIVATKHHLLVNSIVSTAHFRGSLIFAVQLICNRVPKQCCERYDVDRAECVIADRENRPILLSTKFLELICNSRKFYSGGRGGQPDIGRAAKLVVKDYVNGNLLYCAWPPHCKRQVEEWDQQQVEELAKYLTNLDIRKKGRVLPGSHMKVAREVQAAESKMQQWLLETSEDIPQPKPQPMTKRKMRFLIKGKRKQTTKQSAGAYA
ncbi:GTPase LSG1-1 [Babesia sp. Xinjiang]|uniref:GTPase LSG1-1 n=1 Tax=Babesia sp. Xinjiang TaxID=462227 RepID=UPI000A252CE8|nr:GTPase LSG1-1 [Babesia sp. Xinjiang]ORM39457.1 GTPase LSG1-1 [Babesia sp. Xinjiang]